MEMDHVIVTGGAGFLGSFVCERLIGEGKRVTCVDNLLSGREENIDHLKQSRSFRFVGGDVRRMLPDEPVKEIWNLACPASPPVYQNDPIDTLLVNVNGMHAVLELALRHGARVFQASTSEIYGDPEVHPQQEEYRGAVNTTGPRACYDEGKRAAETLCFDFRRKFGLDVRVARIFNTYGPRMDVNDGRVVSNFVDRALKGMPLELYGGGKQTRSFCYVDDLVDGFFKLMGCEHQVVVPINLGNPAEFTIRELGELVLELTGSRSTFIDKPLPTDDPVRRRPDISRAEKMLQWSPKVTLRVGLQKMIEQFERTSKLQTVESQRF